MAGLRVHLCTVGQCMTRIPAPRLFCSRHWNMIPDSCQAEIVDAWIDNDMTGLSAVVAQVKGMIRAAERRDSTWY